MNTIDQAVERTLVLVKPDGVKRGLIGEIIGRLERAGMQIAGLKMVHPTIEKAHGHYPTTEAQLKQMGSKTLASYVEKGIDPEEVLGTSDPMELGKLVHERNTKFLASGPVVACVVTGVNAVKKVRAICGATIPIDAAPGTIRGDFASVSPVMSNLLGISVRNLVHASDNQVDPAEPEKEIAYWFDQSETVRLWPADWTVMYIDE